MNNQTHEQTGEVTPNRTLGKLTQIHEECLQGGSGRVDTVHEECYKKAVEEWTQVQDYYRKVVEEWTQVHEQC
jgi:hypothetical protein